MAQHNPHEQSIAFVAQQSRVSNWDPQQNADANIHNRDESIMQVDTSQTVTTNRPKFEGGDEPVPQINHVAVPEFGSQQPQAQAQQQQQSSQPTQNQGGGDDPWGDFNDQDASVPVEDTQAPAVSHHPSETTLVNPDPSAADDDDSDPFGSHQPQPVQPQQQSQQQPPPQEPTQEQPQEQPPAQKQAIAALPNTFDDPLVEEEEEEEPADLFAGMGMGAPPADTDVVTGNDVAPVVSESNDDLFGMAGVSRAPPVTETVHEAVALPFDEPEAVVEEEAAPVFSSTLPEDELKFDSEQPTATMDATMDEDEDANDTVLSMWQEERRKILRARVEKERDDMLAAEKKAREEIEQFHGDRREKVSQSRERAKNREEGIKADFASVYEHGTYWQQVAKLVDLQTKNPSLERMKNLLIELKNDADKSEK